MAPRKDGSALLCSPLVETEPIKCETCKHQTGRHGTGSSGRMVYEYYCKTPGGTPCWLPGMAACSWYEVKPVCLCESCKWMDEFHPQLGWRCRSLCTWVAFKDKCMAYSEIIDVKALAATAWEEVNTVLCDTCEHHMADKDGFGKRFCAGFAKLVVPKTKCYTYRKAQAPADHGCQCDACKNYRAGVRAQKEKELPGDFIKEAFEEIGQAMAGPSAEEYRKSKRKKLEKALEAAYTIPMIHTMDRETKTVTVIVPPGWNVVVKAQ